MKYFLAVTFSVLCWLPTHILAEDNKNTQPSKTLSLEDINKLEAMENLLDQFKAFEALTEKMSQEKYSDCFKAFGNDSFCQCIRDQSPIGINFVQYVLIVTKTKDELEYSKATEEQKAMVDTTLKARESCVGRHK